MSHVLNLCILERIAASSILPLASLFVLPIVVDSPISNLASEVRIPVLCLSCISSAPKAPHSGLVISGTLSEITIPQILQIISPDSESVTILLFLHTGQAIEVCIIRYNSPLHRQ